MVVSGSKHVLYNALIMKRGINVRSSDDEDMLVITMIIVTNNYLNDR